jgi:hypothetical protein
MIPPRSAAVAATLVVAAPAALCALTGSAAAQETSDACGEQPGVTVVLDPNELGGRTQVTCVPAGDARSAAELFEDAGVWLDYQPGMQDFVCRVDGRPATGPCTTGDAYWSLWWAAPGDDWTYSTLGVRSLEVPGGSSLGFAWHEGDDDAAPPDVTPEGEVGAGEATAADGPRVEGAETAQDADEGSFPWWAAGVAVLVLAAAATVPLLRRRSS